MAPVSRLGRQIQELVRCLDDLGAASALIGGLALATYRVIRATTDVDLLVDARLAESVDGEIRSLGYECLHRSADAANYVRGDERVDFLYASRPAAMDLRSGGESGGAAYQRPAVSAAEAFTVLEDLMAVPQTTAPTEPRAPAVVS